MQAQDLRQEVTRARHGDTDSAAHLFDRYYVRVYRYAYAKLGNSADAEDVAAETFAKMLRSLDGFRWKGAGFEAWLFRIASNLIVDHHRRKGREQLHDDVLETAPPAIDEFTPEVRLLRGETFTELYQLMKELSPEHREVLLLRFAAELDTHEVGEVMGRPVNNVRQLQFRALRKLRKRMLSEVAYDSPA